MSHPVLLCGGGLTINLVDRAESKRRQGQPGVKITSRNFGRDRRMPIANRYHLSDPEHYSNSPVAFASTSAMINLLPAL